MVDVPAPTFGRERNGGGCNLCTRGHWMISGLTAGWHGIFFAIIVSDNRSTTSVIDTGLFLAVEALKTLGTAGLLCRTSPETETRSLTRMRRVLLCTMNGTVQYATEQRLGRCLRLMSWSHSYSSLDAAGLTNHAFGHCHEGNMAFS